MTTGNVASVPIAMISPHRMSKDVMNSAMPSGIVFMSPLVISTLANKNSFHESTNTKTATENMPGKASGNMIVEKVRKNEAPSTQAASSISRGMPSKNDLSIQRAN